MSITKCFKFISIILKRKCTSSILLSYNNQPNIYEFIKNKLIGFVINIPNNKKKLCEEFTLRRLCIDFNIPLFMNLQTIKFFILSIINFNINNIKIKNWEKYIL